MRSNCLIFAVLLTLRRWRKKHWVHISLRPSYWGCFPHFLVMRQGLDGRFRAVSYKPIDPRHKVLPPPLFRGRVAWGDAPPKELPSYRKRDIE